MHTEIARKYTCLLFDEFDKEKYMFSLHQKLLMVLVLLDTSLAHAQTSPEKDIQVIDTARKEEASSSPKPVTATPAKAASVTAIVSPTKPGSPSNPPTADAKLLPVAGTGKQPGEVTLSAPPSDKTNYMSDRVTWPFDLAVQRIDVTSYPKPIITGACAPAGTVFRGIGQTLVDGNAEPSPVFRISKVGGTASTNTANRCKKDDDLVAAGDLVILAPAVIKMTPPDRFGLTYGTLLVPYKYHFSGSDFGSGASVGGYVGYRQDRSGVLGMALQYVGFLGAATIPVSENSNGQVKTENMAGVSYGIGVLGTVKDSFHLGLVLGADRINKSANYRYNGKLWLAASIGFEFSN